MSSCCNQLHKYNAILKSGLHLRGMRAFAPPRLIEITIMPYGIGAYKISPPTFFEKLQYGFPPF